MTYFLGDVNFFKQYHRAMVPMCCALDVIQGEEKAYMGLLLPTLAVTLKQLEILKSDSSLTICSSLIEVLQKSLNQRFSIYFEDMDCIIAAAIYPQFKLAWLDYLDLPQRERDSIHQRATAKLIRENLNCSSGATRTQTAQSSNASHDSETAKDQDDLFSFLYCKEDDKTSSSKAVRDFLGYQPKKVSIMKGFSNNVFEQVFVRYNTAIPSRGQLSVFFCSEKTF